MALRQTRQNNNAASIGKPAADGRQTNSARSTTAASSLRSRGVIGGMGELSGKLKTGDEIESAHEPEQMEIIEAGVEDLKGKLGTTMRLIKVIEDLGTLTAPARQELEYLAVSYKSPSGNLECALHRVTEEKKWLEQENQTQKVTLQNMDQALKRQSEDTKLIKKLRAELQTANNEIERMKQSYEQASQQFKKKEDHTAELQLSVMHGKKDLKNLGIEVKRLTQLLKTSDEKVKQLTKDKIQAEKDLSECKSRLSRLMGNKLSDNNPDIADLSDSNRPTNIAEKYQELYDNQWTDAFSEIEKTYPDQEAKCIGILLDILKTTKEFCVKLSEEQSAEMQRIVKLSEYKLTRSEQLPDLVKKQVKDFRKSVGEVCLTNVHGRFVKEQRRSTRTLVVAFITNPKVSPFVKECVELCWLMTLQDPPVVIGDSTKYYGQFETNVFKAYTQTGDRLSYVVWPPLYLHENGPLLGKGIAQATGNSARGRRRQGQNPGSDASTQETVVVQNDPINQDIDRGSSMSSSVRQPSRVQLAPSNNQRGFSLSTRSPFQGVGTDLQQRQPHVQNVVSTPATMITNNF